MSKKTDSTNIGGEEFWPLAVEQRDAFHEAAKNSDNPLEELVGLTLLHTGLRNGEFCHMRENWLETDDEGELRVVVPYEEVCTGGVGPTGENNASGENLHDRGEPCFRCRDSTSDWVANKKKEGYRDEKWHPKTEASGGRAIPVETLDEDTTDILRWWFRQNTAIPLLHSAVNDKIASITERAGIEREVTAHDLRDTFATDLARQGVDRVFTRDLMGHAETASTDPYYKFTGSDIKSELHEKLS